MGNWRKRLSIGQSPSNKNGSDSGQQFPPTRVHRQPTPPENTEETKKIAVEKSQMVVRCSDLLREKYELDLQIWGMQNCDEDDIDKRNELERKSDAMFYEIQRVVHSWRSSPANPWTTEEWGYVEGICRAVDMYSSGQ